MDEDEEKILCLTEVELLNVLEEQVSTLLKSLPKLELPVPEFLTSFMRYHGHSIRLSDYAVASVTELIEKIPTVAKVGFFITIYIWEHYALKEVYNFLTVFETMYQNFYYCHHQISKLGSIDIINNVL